MVATALKLDPEKLPTKKWPVSAAELLTNAFLLSERGRLSLGPVLGGHPDDYLLVHGPALVRGCHRHLHRPHRLSENGDADVGPRGTAEIPRSEAS